MAQVYLVARRAEVQNGSVMVTDLFPNESQRNTALDPVGAGPIYVRQINLGTSGSKRAVLRNVGGVITFDRASEGLVAFLLRNVESGAGGDALTLSEAITGAEAIISSVRAGAVLDLAAVNAILALPAVGGLATDINLHSSVEDLMRVLAGETYLVPVGSQIEAGGAFTPDLNADSYFQNDVRHPVDGDSSWVVSAEEGALAGLTSDQDAKKGFAGVKTTDPIVTIYNADGTLYA